MGLNKEILRLSMPAIVSNITVPLLGLCDTAISGHLGSDVYLAAIAVGSVMLNVVYWLFGFLRMGTTGLTAEALGAGDIKGINTVFTRSLTIAILSGLVLIALCNPLGGMLLKIVDAKTEVSSEVMQYFLICIWGAPALLAISVINGWFVGMQTTFYAMLVSISVNVINVAASFIFVYTLHIGFEGVAYGTLVANWIGIIIAFGCCIHLRKGRLPICSLPDFMRSGGFRKYFSVNSSLFIRSLCIIAVTLGMTAAAARFGTLALAVNVILMQLCQLFSFFMDGFAFAGEALIGLRNGEGNMPLLRRSEKYLLYWCLGLGILFSLTYGFGAHGIASVLTDSGSVVESVGKMGIIIAILPIISCWAFIFDGFYVGLTATKEMMFSTLLASSVFFLLVYGYIGKGIGYASASGLQWLWIAFLSYLAIRGLFLACLWPRMINKK